MTKFVVSGYIGFDNFGDEAIAGTLTSFLKDNGAEKITLLSSNPQKTAELYGVNSVGMLNFVKPIWETDVFISGGGSLLQDVTSLKSLIYYLALIMFAQVLGKKTIIFAQGFTPFKTRIGKFLTKFVLKRCDKVTVRDKKSQELLNNMGISSELVSDPVFGMEVPKVLEKRGVGVQLRSFPTLNEFFLYNLADKIAEKFPKEEIKLFSMQDSLDLPVLKFFSDLLSDRGLKSKIYNNLTVQENIEEISKLEYLVGMRFHAALVAAKAGVKVLGINYDVKVLNLSKSVGFPIINLKQDDFSKEFEALTCLDTQKYELPKFEFPYF